ncbi:MAG: hypothetical protein LBQ15_11545 [Clostridium sp.]|jgi:putative peptide transport system permease protein|nr:hypothetical protein [Clostridium sp.]
MEVKRSIRSGYFFFCALVVLICFVLGYVLLVSIDQIEHPSGKELYFSIYTVYTQFGMLMFSVLMIYAISSDYREKNILFYKLMEYQWLRYYLTKWGVVFLALSLPTMVGTVAVGMIYGDFSDTFVMLAHFEFVLLYELLLTAFWGFLFPSLMVAFLANLCFWLVSIVLSTGVRSLHVLAYYDASNPVFLNLWEYLRTGNKEYLAIGNHVLYSAVLFGLIVGLVFLFRKRWEKNGI